MQKDNNTSRSNFWDIVKGISIIAIVLGHSGLPGTAFVYLWHLAIFFFATGYFFNEKKYSGDPFGYFGKRLAGAWPRFVFYSLIIVLMHNWLVTHGLIQGVDLYNHTAMLAAWLQSFTFTLSEQSQGAMWFIPAWVLASGLFAACMWTGFPLISSMLCGITGSVLMMRGAGVSYNLHIALAMVPLYYAAWSLRLKVPQFRRYTTWYGWLISGILLHLINVKLHIFFDLVSSAVHGFWFYPISLLGIYHCMSLASVIDSQKQLTYLSKALTVLGKHSFDIMSLHFLIFKLTDFAYARYVLHQGPEGLGGFPLTFREIAPVHFILGIVIPLICGFAVDKAEHRINRTINPTKTQ